MFPKLSIIEFSIDSKVIFIRRLMILRLLTVGISTMTNLKAGYHEHLTRPGVKYDEEMSICLLESDPKMSRSHANVVSFDENFLSTSVNLYERKEHFFMNETQQLN